MTPIKNAPQSEPRNPTDLFIAFTLMALQGFGGVMTVVHRELVEKKRWLSDAEFIEDWSVAQLMPGPNVVNMSLMLGNRYFGVRGALAALAGLLTLPLVVVLLLALVHARYADHPGVIGALRGMGAVTAGLIAATGLKLMKALKVHPLQLPVCIGLSALCFLMIAILRWPLLYVLLGLGLVGCTLTYRRLKP
jgi:chromate transporter